MRAQRAFLSVPLIALLRVNQPERQRYQKFYDQVATTCKKRKLQMNDEGYWHGYPNEYDFVHADVIYEDNWQRIAQSDLVIAYVGLVSAGVSMHIEMAHHFDMPVVLLYEEDAIPRISKMIFGCPAARDRIFAPDLEGVAARFDERLDVLLKRINNQLTPKPQPGRREFLELLNKAHASSGLSLQQVGERPGINKGYISRLLKGSIENPSRDQIIKLCVWGWNLDRRHTNEILEAGEYQQL